MDKKLNFSIFIAFENISEQIKFKIQSGGLEMKSKFLGLLLIVIVFLTSCDVDNTKVEETKSKWQQDLEFFAQELPKQHKNLFFKTSSAEFYNKIETLKTKIDTLDESEIFISLLEIVSSVGDSHTNVVANNLYLFNYYPFKGYWFKDGFYITSVSENYKQILGKKLVRVGNTSINEVFEKMKKYISYENEQQVKQTFPQLIIFSELLQFMNFSDTKNSCDFEFEGVGTVKINSLGYNDYIQTTLIDVLDENNTQPALYQQNQSNYHYKYLSDQKLLYFQYNRCQEDNQKSFGQFNNELFTFIENNPVEKLVLDIRNNPGGNSGILQPFINKIAANENLNKEGNLYTILGRRTFSSAILNALEIDEKTHSVFVGEPTGGKPNHYGEIRYFNLPNSGYKVYYSTKYFEFVSGDPESIYPDYLIELSFNEFVNGIDPALDFIKKK